MKTFDVFDSPLQGAVLIEAGAGTGKTHTITGCYVRLVTEKRLPVEQILVVTFTEAATAELKGRIRERLREAAAVLRGGRARDRFMGKLAERFQGDTLALQSLETALRSFDRAAIFTIHGFCLRMLGEHAFESGFLFNAELSTDQEPLQREIAEDYWRRMVYAGSRLFVNYLLNRGMTPDTLRQPLARYGIHPRLRIVPRVEPPDTETAEKEFQTALGAALAVWKAERGLLTEILLTDESLNRRTYSPARTKLLIRRMDEMTLTDVHGPDLFPDAERLTRAAIVAGTKKNQSPPSHPFFDRWERLLECREELSELFRQRLIKLKTGLLDYLRTEVARRNREKNVRGFDDLLTQLHQALDADTGADLAAAVRRNFKAALIDEFQDTDLIQYDIFYRIFHHPEGLLFLIGDPKQAIYGFRGADIFAYLEAAGKVGARFTLKENWRSHPDLIQALNLLFRRTSRPFVFEEIVYEPAAAPADKTEYERLLENGQPPIPFRLWFLGSGEDQKPLSKAVVRERIVRSVAGEIARLLALSRQGLAAIGNRPLEPGDVAVLVRRNQEADLLRQALAAFHIPAVVHGSGDIFQTGEAFEMELLLRGILYPENVGALKAAMVTDLIGISGDELMQLEGREELLESRTAVFRDYHDWWRREGFIRMFRRLMRRENMLLRLMAFPDGERRVTNVAQLTELLHQESRLEKNGMEGLLQWLARRRTGEQVEMEERQLRLETDAGAVQLITMHKSKGLEFPVVFCPFTWDGSRLGNRTEAFAFHAGDGSGELVLELGSPDADGNRLAAERELLAENLRLFYVALTRARSRCYLVWGHFSEAETSAPAYVLHPRTDPGDPGKVTGFSDWKAAGTSAALYRELEELVREAPEIIRLEIMPEKRMETPLPLEADVPAMACRPFTRGIERTFRIASFSSFVHRHPLAGELADRDALAKDSPPEARDFSAGSTDGKDIFSFPRGAKPGTCLHAVFEEIDFTEPDSKRIREVVADKLRLHRFDPSYEPAVTAMVRKVLSVPLEPGETDLRLELIDNRQRLNEMEFYFPLTSFRPRDLQRIFRSRAHGRFSPGALDLLGRLEATELRGYMKGFIDLVFRHRERYYIVDWKSNHLGHGPEEYHPGRLARIMEEELYFLQYHIYTVALNRYLRSRLPGFDFGAHFGGVFYLFLRGVEPRKSPHLGVYRDKPDETLIRELTDFLTGGSG
ncbi:MAG: exodeoxyribonuclease V subunit beta [Thermodesulfobacteriota bacterium]